MIEVEVKLPVSNGDEVSRLLKQNGFIRTKEAIEIDHYYSSDFHDMRAHDEALRIRSYIEKDNPHNSCSLLTFKGPKMDSVSMTRKELETKISDAGILHQILNAIDYYEAGTVQKKRVYYRKDHITVCMDHVKDLGSYLEVEILAKEEDEREECLNKIRKLLLELGLDIQTCVNTSYLSMLQKKQ